MASNITTISNSQSGSTVRSSLNNLINSYNGIVNVRDWGATGDGVTDDTAAIQAALDHAYGPFSTPHGGLADVGSDLYDNKPVYFPAGQYLVRPPAGPWTVTGCADDGSNLWGGGVGRIRLTVADTTGLSNNDTIFVRDVTGTTFANYSYAIQDVDATHVTLKLSQFNAAWTGGGTFTRPALLTRASGGYIFGAGKGCTSIICDVDNAVCFGTNGWFFSRVEGLSFAAVGGGIAFDLNGDGDADFDIGLQSNKFADCNFGGIGGETIDYCLTIGMGQFMGSENTITDCFFGSADIAGIYIGNYNAISNTLYNGNIANCQVGVLMNGAVMPIISGTGFQNYQREDQVDIQIVNATNTEGMTITGTRTESDNFLLTGPETTITMNGCGMGGGTGYFHSGHAKLTMNGCSSSDGYIEGDGAYLIINNCKFTSSDYLTRGTENWAYVQINPMPITEQTGATYTITSTDGGSKIKFNRATGQVVTVLKNSDNSCRLTTGTKIEVQQTGAGQTTFANTSGITIRSSNGLKLRAQYSCATLTCDGSDLWTLSGDTTT